MMMATVDGEPGRRAIEAITMDGVVRIEAAPVTGSRRVKALAVALLCAVHVLNLSGG
jgi:hypothetical protein